MIIILLIIWFVGISLLTAVWIMNLYITKDRMIDELKEANISLKRALKEKEDSHYKYLNAKLNVYELHRTTYMQFPIIQQRLLKDCMNLYYKVFKQGIYLASKEYSQNKET